MSRPQHTAEKPESPVARLEGVWFSYGRQPVLEDVSFSIAAGQTVCLVGPNGGGKTTLLKLIAGLLMGRLGAGGLRGRLGWYSPEDRRAACEALATAGMLDRAQVPFAELSGGERQRVLIARALCVQPELLLLDEPTANVDPRFEAQLFDIVRQLEGRMTVVLVSHDLGVVSTWVQTVVCVNRRVVVHPTAELTGELLQEIYEGEVRLVRHGHVLPSGGRDAGSLHP